MKRRNLLLHSAGLLGGTMAPALVRGAPCPPSSFSLDGGPPVTVACGTPATGFAFDAGFSGSGSPTDGQVITISKSGGGFGAKPNSPKPLRWIPLDSSMQPDATYSRDASPLSVRAGCSIQAGVKPRNAAGAANQVINGLHSHTLFENAPVWSFNTGRCYVYVKRYHAHADHNGSGEALNCKTIRLWPASGPGDPPDCYYSIGSNLSLCLFEGTALDPSNASRFYDGGFVFSAYDNNTFAACEHVYRGGSVDALDGLWNHARNGRWLYASNVRWMTRSSANPAAIATGYLDQISNGTPPGSIYYHSLYIDDSLCRILVSDEASYSVAAGASGPRFNREIQIPTAWSDHSVSFLLRQGSHATLKGKYLYVVTDANVALRVGQFL